VFLVLVGLDAAKPTQEDFFILPCRHTNWGSINFNGVSNAFSDSLPDPDSLDIQTTSDCITCIDPPGDGDPTLCTPTNQYRLEASVDDYGAYIYNSTIPTWRLTPFWGGIIQRVMNEVENFEQDYTSLYEPSPYAPSFDLDRRLKVETNLNPNSELSFSITLYDLIARVFFSSNSAFVSNARIKIEAEAIIFEGMYQLSSDTFSITNVMFEGLNTYVNANTNFGLIGEFLVYVGRSIAGINNSQLEGIIEVEINNEINSLIDNVNRNSPNMFIKSLVDYPEISNLLILFDQAVSLLLQDDVSASLNLHLPSCGDIVREGLIKLQVIEN